MHQVKLGAFNSEEFVSFLRELLSLPGFQTRSHNIVMDNVRFHKTDEVRAVFSERAVQHFLHFLPPYSPQLNPIEHCFAKIKWHVKTEEKQNRPQLLQLIEQAVAKVTRENCSGWYHEVTRQHFKCIQGAPLE